MDKVKILVVEDEIIIADNICDTLEDLGYEALEPAINYTEAINTLETEKPDLAILDIQLSGKKTGIDIAQKIEEQFGIPFIFLTSNTDAATVNEAKKVMPLAYLVKPFTKDELYSSVEIALYKHSQNTKETESENVIIKDALFLKDKGVFTKVFFEEILYLKSAHVYVEFILKDKKNVVVRGSMEDISIKLPESFIRLHRSFIINTSHLTQFNGVSVKIGNETIPVSRKYKQPLLDKINFI